MIQIVFTIVSLLILTVAVVSKGGLPKTNVTPEHSEVLSDQSEQTPTPTETPSPTPSVVETVPASPSAVPTTDTWVYPGATVTKSLPLTMTISADQKIVTDWYKNKIKALGFNATSFIVTSTNDKIYNKLVAAKNNQRVEVVINRDMASEPVAISVTFSSEN